VFEAGTIARLRENFQVLLRGIVFSPDQRISTLPLLGETERRQVVEDWNRTGRDFPRDKTVHQLFEEQVQRNPDAIAVVCGDLQLTYGELNARANRLAQHLIRLGVGPDCLVGIALERSLRLLVALLGTFKAGGAYVPLDPEYPPARLADLLADSAPVVVVTTTSLRDRLPGEIPVLCLDEDATRAALTDTIARNPTDADRTEPLRPDHAAYVIYTSGSTGVPKGVLIEHRALANHMAWMAGAYPLESSDRVLSRTSVNFDASVWEI